MKKNCFIIILIIFVNQTVLFSSSAELKKEEEFSIQHDTEYYPSGKNRLKLYRKKIPLLIERNLCIDVCSECFQNDSNIFDIYVSTCSINAILSFVSI